jgi:hypothetical protein
MCDKRTEERWTLAKISAVLMFVPLCLPSSASAAGAIPDGTTLYNKYCSVCHAVSSPSMSAPPMRKISSLYRSKYPGRTEGSSRIMAFVKLPSVKNAIDQDAITKYGLMSRVPATGREMQAVAEWLWDLSAPSLIPVK